MNINELVNQIVTRRNLAQGTVGGSKSIDDLLQAADIATFLSSSPADATRAVGPDNVRPENIGTMDKDTLTRILTSDQEPVMEPQQPDNVGTMTPEMLDMILKEMSTRPR